MGATDHSGTPTEHDGTPRKANRRNFRPETHHFSLFSHFRPPSPIPSVAVVSKRLVLVGAWNIGTTRMASGRHYGQPRNLAAHR